MSKPAALRGVLHVNDDLVCTSLDDDAKAAFGNIAGQVIFTDVFTEQAVIDFYRPVYQWAHDHGSAERLWFRNGHLYSVRIDHDEAGYRIGWEPIMSLNDFSLTTLEESLAAIHRAAADRAAGGATAPVAQGLRLVS